MSYCVTASCLAHRERIFWQPPEQAWVHTNGYPCEAMAGEPDPTELHCRYCGALVQRDGAGHLWEYAGRSAGRWERQPDGLLQWRDESYTGGCSLSPTFTHEEWPMHLRHLGAS